MNETARLQRLALSLCNRMGRATLERLLARFGTPAEILGAGETALREAGVTSSMAASIRRHADLAEARRVAEQCESLGVTLVSLDESGYPPLLGEIHSPPLFLYVRGNVDALSSFAIAIVGSRRCNAYGKQQARRFGAELAAAGAAVVSGLARGIDAEAHAGALDSKGVTVAVMGCGIDVVYPAEHRQLRDRIAAEGGALVSELPPGTPPVAGNFPLRNRVISGLSRGVLVIQAGEGSGALLTANWAIEQNRDMFALPDRVDHPYSRGSHELIQRSQAKLVMAARDILAEYPEYETDGAASETGASPAIELSDEARTVFACLDSEESHIDEIVAATGLAAADVNAVLLRLQISGLVRSLPGMYYQKM